MRRLFVHAWVFLVSSFVFPVLAADLGQEPEKDSSDSSKVKFYSNPEECREAGLGIQLTDTIKLSGLIEYEEEYNIQQYANSINVRESEHPSVTVQLGLFFELSANINAELIIEAEQAEKNTEKVEEAFIEIKVEDVGLTLGRISLPFGEYYSHFVTGPLLEFGEAKGDALVVDYSPFDAMEFGLFASQGNIDDIHGGNDIDWGAFLELQSADESIRFGISFFADLSESDGELLGQANYYSHRVSAWSSYLLLGYEHYEIFLEMVLANGGFDELEAEINQPKAWNIELAYFLSPNIQLSFRFEASDEIEEEPEKQRGISVAWSPIQHVPISFDYLHGRFKNNAFYDDSGNELEERDQLVLQIGWKF